MTSRHSDERQYAAHLDMLESLRTLPARHQAERDAVEREAAAVVDSAMTAERDAKDRVAATRRSLDEATGKVSRLIASSGAVEAAGGAPVPDRLADFDAATRAVLSDLRSAESAWSWVERAQRAAVARAPGPVQVAPPVAASPSVQPARAGAVPVRALAIAAVVAVLILIAGIVAMLRL